MSKYEPKCKNTVVVKFVVFEYLSKLGSVIIELTQLQYFELLIQKKSHFDKINESNFIKLFCNILIVKEIDFNRSKLFINRFCFNNHSMT